MYTASKNRQERQTERQTDRLTVIITHIQFENVISIKLIHIVLTACQKCAAL